MIIPGDKTGLEGLKKSIRLIWTELALILLKGRMNGVKVDRLRLYASLRLLHMLLGNGRRLFRTLWGGNGRTTQGGATMLVPPVASA